MSGGRPSSSAPSTRRSRRRGGFWRQYAKTISRANRSPFFYRDENGALRGFKYRTPARGKEKKFDVVKGSGVQDEPFGIEGIDPAFDVVVVVEGELKQAALSRVYGIPNVISLPAGAKSWKSDWSRHVQHATGRFFVATDADKPGEEAAAKLFNVAAEFPAQQLLRVRFHAPDGTVFNDACDAQAARGEPARRATLRHVRAFRRISVRFAPMSDTVPTGVPTRRLPVLAALFGFVAVIVADSIPEGGMNSWTSLPAWAAFAAVAALATLAPWMPGLSAAARGAAWRAAVAGVGSLWFVWMLFVLPGIQRNVAFLFTVGVAASTWAVSSAPGRAPPAS